MPARTNDFQRLMTCLQRHLASDAVVTESKLLADRITGTKREVDIAVETQINGIDTVMCFECRDRSRKEDVRWVDEMIGKHARLPTDILVLVSSSGFSAEASRVASQASNVRLLNFEETPVSPETDPLSGMKSVWRRQGQWKPLKVITSVQTSASTPPSDIVLFSDSLIYDQSGKELGTAKEVVSIILGSDPVQRGLMERAKPEDKFFVFQWPAPGQTEPTGMQLLSIESNRFDSIINLQIHGACEIETEEVILKRGKLGETLVAWGNSLVDGVKHTFISTRDPKDNSRISFSPD